MDPEVKVILDSLTQQQAQLMSMVEKLNKTVYFGNGTPPITTTVSLIQADIREIQCDVREIKGSLKAGPNFVMDIAKPLAIVLITALIVLAVQHGFLIP